MDPYILIAALAVVTFVLVMFLASASKRQTDNRPDDRGARKSTLATDAPDRS